MYWTNYFLRADNTYAQEMLKKVHGWLEDDEVVMADARKMQKVDRVKVCWK